MTTVTHIRAKKIEAFLNAKCDDYSFNQNGGKTWADWVHGVLSTLEREVDGFSGKRPFGDSGWHTSLCIGLLTVRPDIAISDPTFDEDGYIQEFEIDYDKVSSAWEDVLDYLLMPRR
jgi:hypothetical protein